MSSITMQPLKRLHTWTAIILLAILLVPRCVMAMDVAAAQPTEQAMPCHGKATIDPQKVQINCAQQCEQSMVSTSTVKESGLKTLDHPVAAAIPPQTFVASLSSRSLHQGWPPDNQLFLTSTPTLYLDTGRLRL